jgi:ketosteroid isomerase-like protein
MTDTADFIRSMYAAFGKGDVKTILDNLDPTVEWWSNCDSNTFPWGGRREGVAGAASFFQALGDNLDFESFEPREFYSAGDTLTVVGHTRARNKKAGRGLFDCEWVHIFALRDGKLASFREFYDTAAMERALTA